MPADTLCVCPMARWLPVCRPVRVTMHSTSTVLHSIHSIMMIAAVAQVLDQDVPMHTPRAAGARRARGRPRRHRRRGRQRRGGSGRRSRGGAPRRAGSAPGARPPRPASSPRPGCPAAGARTAPALYGPALSRQPKPEFQFGSPEIKAPENVIVLVAPLPGTIQLGLSTPLPGVYTKTRKTTFLHSPCRCHVYMQRAGTAAFPALWSCCWESTGRSSGRSAATPLTL